MRRQVAARLGEQLDISNHRHMSVARVRRDRVAVQRDAGRHNDAGKTDQVNIERVADVGAQRHRIVARVLAVVPRGDPGAAGHQRLDRREPRAR